VPTGFFEPPHACRSNTKQTIVVTLYNPPNAPLLKSHYEHLPEKLAREGVNPQIPWLYNFKIDFRFK